MRGSAEGLARMYSEPLARAAQRLGSLSLLRADRWAQDDSPASRGRLLAGLPVVRRTKHRKKSSPQDEHHLQVRLRGRFIICSYEDCKVYSMKP